MSWLEALTDQWGGRGAAARLAFRFVGTTVFAYVLAVQGVFTGPLWVALVTGLALVLAYVIMVLRMRTRFNGLGLGLVVAMMVCGAVVNPQIGYTGTAFFVIGGIILIGQPQLPVPAAVAIMVPVSVLLILASVLQQQTWAAFVTTASGALVVGLLGAVRRQRSIRELQDQALAIRSRELEQRNAELLAQTERTRQETARVAALQERSRIARDLHDLLAHALGGLVVQLDAAGAELDHGQVDRAAERLRTSRRLAVDGLREARAAVQELRGDDAGDRTGPTDPVEALQTLIHGPVGVHLGARLEVLGESRPVPARVADALTAVCREALTNVNKHAPGAVASATLVFTEPTVRLEIVNGLTRLSPGEMPSELSGSGVGAGLAGLAERVRLAGGRLSAGPEGRRWVLAVECPSPRDVGADRSAPVGAAQELP